MHWHSRKIHRGPADVRVCRHGANRLHPSFRRRSRAPADDRRRSQPSVQAYAAGVSYSLLGRALAGVRSHAARWRQSSRRLALAGVLRRARVDGLSRDKTRKLGRAPMSVKVVAEVFGADTLGNEQDVARFPVVGALNVGRCREDSCPQGTSTGSHQTVHSDQSNTQVSC